MGDILKEAIADAKAVRETALQNAKMALEEAFTPQLQSMLSAKLREEEDEGGEEEMGGEEEEAVEEQDDAYDEKVGKTDASHLAEEEDEEGEGGEEIEEIAEEEEGEVSFSDEEAEEGELDLESIIRELESEITEQDDAYDESDPGEKPEHVGGNIGEGEEEGDEEYEIDEAVFEEQEDEEDEEAVEEQSDSSNIGSGDNVVNSADAGDEEDPGNSTDVESFGESIKSLKSELKEYKEAVQFLKDKLHEVNILNAKLLFTNKLFKEFALDNNQKLKVVETFDRTQSTREIKLVYSTLCEQFSDNGSISKKHSIKESASSSIGSTKPSKKSQKVITEEDQVANRFKKLAGII